MTGFPVQQSGDGVIFSVRVHPGARRNGVTGLHDEALKISLSTPPVDGRANEALVEFIAEWLHVPRSAVTIASGEHSRSKRVRVAGIAAKAVSTAAAELL